MTTVARHRLIGAAGGALSALCWFPAGFGPLLPVMLVLVFVALRRVGSAREAIWLGAAVGAARFAVGAHFLLALLRYSPLAIVFYLMSIAYIVPFSILETWGAYTLERRTGVPRALGFVGLWAVSEKLRTMGDLAFPADITSHYFGTAPGFMAFAAWIGPMGQALLAAGVAALLAHAVFAWPARRPAATWAAIGLALWCTPLAAARLAPTPSTAVATAKPLRVGIVQPSIAMEDKVDPARANAIWGVLNGLTKKAAEGADLVLWPETARPNAAILRDGRIEDAAMSSLAKEIGVPILYGTIIAEVSGKETIALYNGAALALPDGTIPQWYGKQRLLPFVEGIPFANVLGLDPRSRAKSGPRRGYLGMLGNFLPGPEPTLFRVGDARIGVMVCFEGMVPDVARTYRAAGANALAVITNDMWWGRSVFPHWHARMIAARARENGLPVVRAANNGISSSNDADGALIARTGMFEATTLSVTLAPAETPPALYARWGDWPIGVVLAGIGVALVRSLVARRNRRGEGDDSGFSRPRAA